MHQIELGICRSSRLFIARQYHEGIVGYMQPIEDIQNGTDSIVGMG
ncbi:hypothetical protein [Rhodopirellula baltica]|uniref:Uncharacterized protein n=1 Tax=Rhodopirellula baltica SWK14 TaxID=993516 RepID=L7CEQ4_RHOBT|nr:hypothetical protein [Rhodopirellula baltica]ELP32739.1 hypothetical protein RBSWK_03310 [Rhodopirellula baltica SWK14]